MRKNREKETVSVRNLQFNNFFLVALSDVIYCYSVGVNERTDCSESIGIWSAVKDFGIPAKVGQGHSDIPRGSESNEQKKK